MTRDAILWAFRQAQDKGRRCVYAVLGAGNGGLPLAGYLGLQGFEVRLWNRTESRLAGVAYRGGVDLDGEVCGFGPLALATTDCEAAMEGADILMVATPSTAHRGLAERMAPYLRPGQVVVLNPGRTGGALEFRQVLRERGVADLPVIAEAQTFLFASRATGGSRGHIFRIKNSVPLAALPSYWTPEVLRLLEPALPQFTGGSNVLATSLENIGAIFHPALTMLNAGWIESTGGRFDYYLDGITPATAKVLQRLDEERVAVARALGVRSVSAREWLYLSYDSPGRDLEEAIHNTSSYAGIRAPSTIDHRYISEDVPMSLVPMASLGAMLGVPTPTIDLMVDLANLLHGTDFRSVGRTVESLGLAGLSVRSIHGLVYDPAAD